MCACRRGIQHTRERLPDEASNHHKPQRQQLPSDLAERGPILLKAVVLLGPSRIRTTTAVVRFTAVERAAPTPKPAYSFPRLSVKKTTFHISVQPLNFRERNTQPGRILGGRHRDIERAALRCTLPQWET